VLENTVANNADVDLVQRCLEGDEGAVKNFQEVTAPYLKGLLVSRGATTCEAEDIVAGLLADCLTGSSDRPPLFHRYSGSSPLRSWLSAISFNRWISLRRHCQVHARAMEVLGQSNAGVAPHVQPGSDLENEMMQVVERALRAALAACEPEEIVLLQMVHLHDVCRRDLATLAGCHESQLGRRLKATERKIAENTLAAVREIDPFLELNWEDFLRLCENFQILGS